MAKKTDDQYARLGVASNKSGIVKVFKGTNRKLFPHAFCVIHYDPILGVYYVMHIDGSGSKSIVRALYFLETGDETIFIFDLYDAVSMNTGDVAACGFTEIFKINNVKGINGIRINKKAFLKGIAKAEQWLKRLYSTFGIQFEIEGGETADLPNQTGSYTLDVSIFTYLKNRSRIIQGNVQPGDNIWGYRSDGQALWENEYNFGLMSNGLSLAQIKLLHKDYTQKYPFLALTNPFEGRYYFDEFVPSINSTVAKAILSPTRQWAILIKMLIDNLENSGNLDLLHGITMNTGGGATKILNIGADICYRKNMPEPSPIFQLIQAESGQRWRNMFTTFNCVIGVDVVGDPKGGRIERAIQRVSLKSNVKWAHLGDCTKSTSPGNTVKLYTQYGDFFYR